MKPVPVMPVPEPPAATYRLQFQQDFNLKNLEEIILYLQLLGVGSVYASPLFRAVPGSTHGYDVLDPGRINPEIGTKESLLRTLVQLKKRGIGWLQDIVPNHMACDMRNPWLVDVLEKGSRSRYASFFDTGLTDPLFKGRLMLPFLGAPLEEELQSGNLKLAYEGKRLRFRYHDQSWPLHARSYISLLRRVDNPSLQELAKEAEDLETSAGAKAPSGGEYAFRWSEFLVQLSALLQNKSVRAKFGAAIRELNRQPEALKAFAAAQVYELCSWKESDKRMNFRRFFTINSLICLNIQDPEVFREYHGLTKELLDKGLFTGLRVDHVDGLYDPTAYLEHLRLLAGDNTYIVVEKILEGDEPLPADWPVEGSTGYDFMAMLTNLFTWQASSGSFRTLYERLSGEARPFEHLVREKKAAFLEAHMGGELDYLVRLFREIPGMARLPEGTASELKTAIADFLVFCPVYRYYTRAFPFEAGESLALAAIFRQIREIRGPEGASLDLLEAALLEPPVRENGRYRQKVLHFFRRCMQFSGPLMAKGVEDTLMYSFNRFIAHNEVGDSPDAFGTGPEHFHLKMAARMARWPHSMNATATHDTKRGEDVRARLNVISCLPEEWARLVGEWQEMNLELKQENAPDANEEYFIYQTLLGAWPEEAGEEESFRLRMHEYMVKALREAKVHTDWSEPDTRYEAAVLGFIDGLFAAGRPFRESLLGFLEQVREPGRINSLSQLLLKCCCPGVPDIYQGCELWDFSLVDPDNRRPVDYGKRKALLQGLEGGKKEQAALIRELWEDARSGRIKMWMLRLLLRERREEALLFSSGEYIPLRTAGAFREQVLAFARRHGSVWYLIAVPLYPALICREQGTKVTEVDWKDTRILLPAEAPSRARHLLDGGEHSCRESLLLSDIFGTLPLAFLKLRDEHTQRGAGILMHISSLPSRFGIGDLGPEARAFADFLGRSRQKYWQVLPLTPLSAEQAFSPYSAVSGMAGNPLLISPEDLAAEGLLEPEDLRGLESSGQVEYDRAVDIKLPLLEKAWKTFSQKAPAAMKKKFEDFCRKEWAWLEDFCLYQCLKEAQGGRPWYEWAPPYRKRQSGALARFARGNEEAIQKEKWLQFIFARQWHALREYCRVKGIRLFGDLPFYISHDSADVWSQPHLFSLDSRGKLRSMAGVPPDYFNSEGQLWGMPVFRWDVLKAGDYAWWLKRIRKNLEWFDLLRLDHFRAFSAYWEVPGGERTAANGRWQDGPGEDFFRILDRELGCEFFVAEDLGDIDKAVYDLRDQFGLPGMKVLQFAFGEDMPRSGHIPHLYTPNFIAYTGTHDNNTTVGWYRQELGAESRKRLEDYAATEVNEGNVHQVLRRMAYASVARIAIVPMQDILGLDEKARMNTPASAEGNWHWRLFPQSLTGHLEEELREQALRYGRA